MIFRVLISVLALGVANGQGHPLNMLDLSWGTTQYLTASTPAAMTKPFLFRSGDNSDSLLAKMASPFLDREEVETLSNYFGFEMGSESRLLVEEIADNALEPEQLCKQTDNPTPQWFIYTAAACFIVFGLMYCFFGWRVFEVTVFLIAGGIGWCLGFYFVLYICNATGNATESWSFWVALITGVVLGILAGYIAIKVIPVAFFFIGAACGMFVGLICNNLMRNHVTSYPTWGVWVWVIVLGIVFGAIGVCTGKVFVMASTAWSGASLTATGIGLLMFEADMHPGGDTSFVCGGKHGAEFWIYLVVTIVGALAGFFVQYKFFWNHGSKYDNVKSSN